MLTGTKYLLEVVDILVGHSRTDVDNKQLGCA